MRLSDHGSSFRHEQYKNKLKLSSFIWETKNKGQNFETEDDDVFPVGVFWYFLYEHVCPLLTSHFILD